MLLFVRGLFVIAVAALLAGCHKQPPRFSDAEMQRIHRESPGLTDECLDKIRWDGFEAMTENCYKFDPPRRWKGLWLGQFETSRFCPEPARQCTYDTPGESIWLTVGPSVRLPLPPWNGDTSPVLFEVDFVGRKTSYAGGYGHQGGYQQEIIMDRLISMKRLPIRKG